MTWIDRLCSSYGEKQWYLGIAQSGTGRKSWCRPWSKPGVLKREDQRICAKMHSTYRWAYIVAPFWPFGFFFLPKISSWTYRNTWYPSFHCDFGSPSELQLYLPFGLRLLLMHCNKDLVFSILQVNPYAQPLASRNLHSNYSWWLGAGGGGKGEAIVTAYFERFF